MNDNAQQCRCIRRLAKALRITQEQAAWRWVTCGCAEKWRAYYGSKA